MLSIMSVNWQLDRRLSEFSTFGIGGAIGYFAEVKSSDEMGEAFAFCRAQKIPFFILGKGSNCLFDDAGFAGAVLLNRIDFCHWNEHEVTAGAGYSFSLLGVQSARKGLSGLEFASGIPATVGGAVFMNAGANGQEASDTLRSVSYLDGEGTVRELAKEDLCFRYRHSSFHEMRGAILQASFLLHPKPQARKFQLDLVNRRMDTQPLKEKNAGCIFRNPTPNRSAGALIDQCGLKGCAVGGAVVSELHANFIINRNGASAKDVLELIETIRTKVYEQTGIHLESEIRVIPNAS